MSSLRNSLCSALRRLFFQALVQHFFFHRLPLFLCGVQRRKEIMKTCCTTCTASSSQLSFFLSLIRSYFGFRLIFPLALPNADYMCIRCSVMLLSIGTGAHAMAEYVPAVYLSFFPVPLLLLTQNCRFKNISKCRRRSNVSGITPAPKARGAPRRTTHARWARSQVEVTMPPPPPQQQQQRQ